MPHCLLLRLQRANELITFYPGRMPWAIILLGLRPATARNHDCCNTRYCLYSLDALHAATEFFEIIRHVRVVPCHSVAMMRNVTSVSSQQQFRDLHLSKGFSGNAGLIRIGWGKELVQSHSVPHLIMNSPLHLERELYFFSNFAPPLHDTSDAAQYLWLWTFWNFVPQFPRYRGCCAITLNSSPFTMENWHTAKTGWKPKRYIAQSNALGTVELLFSALKEQKEWENCAAQSPAVHCHFYWQQHQNAGNIYKQHALRAKIRQKWRTFITTYESTC